MTSNAGAGQRLWTSDQHFGHTNIIRYCNRPFADVAEMNEVLIDRWNETVSDIDTVWVLGDVALGPIKESLALVRRLRGRKVLVAGNHDRCWAGGGPMSTPWVDVYRDAGFEEVLQGWVSVQLGERRALACHLPYEGDSHDDDRFTAQRPIDKGELLLHGHVHDRWRIKANQVNVGVDVWDYRPVSDQTILDAIEAAATA